MAFDRLKTAKNVWVATVRENGQPHLVPVWFVAHDGALYFVTDPNSVKARNLQHNPRIAVALEDGDAPYVVEGLAAATTPPAEVIRLFKEKYDWDIESDGQYSQTFEVAIAKHLFT